MEHTFCSMGLASSKLKTATPVLPSPLTKSSSPSDGIVAVWNVLLYHVLSDHAKSFYDSGPEGIFIDCRGIENADYI